LKERNMVRRKQEEVHNSQNVNYKSIYDIYLSHKLWICGIFIYKKIGKNSIKFIAIAPK